MAQGEFKRESPVSGRSHTTKETIKEDHQTRESGLADGQLSNLSDAKLPPLTGDETWHARPLVADEQLQDAKEPIFPYGGGIRYNCTFKYHAAGKGDRGVDLSKAFSGYAHDADEVIKSLSDVMRRKASIISSEIEDVSHMETQFEINGQTIGGYQLVVEVKVHLRKV